MFQTTNQQFTSCFFRYLRWSGRLELGYKFVPKSSVVDHQFACTDIHQHGGFLKRRYPKNGWLIRKNLLKWMIWIDLGAPLCLETTIWALFLHGTGKRGSDNRALVGLGNWLRREIPMNVPTFLDHDYITTLLFMKPSQTTMLGNPGQGAVSSKLACKPISMDWYLREKSQGNIHIS